MTIGCCNMQPRWRQPLSPAEWRKSNRVFEANLVDGLRNPTTSVTPQQLADLFDMDILDLTAKLPSGIQDMPDLPVRIRGALGRALADLPPPLTWRLDPFARSRAFDILYQSLGTLEGRTAIPKPLAVHADIIGQTLRIRVILVGAAGYWWPDVAVALQAALEGGINLHNDGRFRVAVTVQSLLHSRQCGVSMVDLPITPGTVRIHLMSPLRIRSARAEHFGAASFLISLANRINAMARWQHLRLELDWPALHQLAWQTNLEAEQLTPILWQRGSIRQAGEGRIPVLGYVGSFSLSGNIAPVVPLVRIAEYINTGSHAALGFGRIRAAFYP